MRLVLIVALELLFTAAAYGQCQCGSICPCTPADQCGCLQFIQAKVEPPKAEPVAPAAPAQPKLVCGPYGCQMILLPPAYVVPQAMPAAFAIPVDVNLRVQGPIVTWRQNAHARKCARWGVCK